MIPSPAPIRLLAVDDHPLLREGIRSLLNDQPELSLVGEAASGQEAVRQFRLLRPDVTLMDLQMHNMSGIEAILAIRAEFSDARIIVLTTFSGDALAQRALRAGAAAYVLKGLVRQELLETIRAVHQGLKRIHPDVAVQIASHTGEDLLTPRELEVLALVATGNSNKRIGAKLLVNEDTVKAHVSRILSKLGASDRTHAVTLALRRGIIEL